MRQIKQPAPINYSPTDPDGSTWALPEGAIARLGKGRGAKIALSSKNTYFAVGTMIGLWWYDMSSKSPIAFWETERGMISAVEFSPNGNWIATANWDGEIKVLDTQSGECLAKMKRMQEHNIYWYITFSPDSKRIATANFKGHVEVLDIHKGMNVTQMDRGERGILSADVYRIEFSPNGQYLAATADNIGSEGTQSYVWCHETGELIFKFECTNFSFSQDSSLLAGVTSYESIDDNKPINHYVSVWNLMTGEQICQFGVKSGWMDDITFSPCGQFLTISSRDDSLRVWNVKEHEKKETFVEFGSSRIKQFYSDNGELFAIVDGEDNVEVWNVENKEKLTIPDIHPRSVDALWLKEYPQAVLADITLNKMPNIGNNIHLTTSLRKFDHVPEPIIFLPGGKKLASTSSSRGIMLWDVESKKAQETLLEDKRITSFTILPCGNIIGAYIRPNEDYGCVWDAGKPEEPILEITEHAQLTWKIAFAPKGDRLAVGSRDGTIYHWDLEKKKRLNPFKGHTEFIWSVEYTPDGKRFVSGSSDRTARMWEVESSKEIGTLPLKGHYILMKIAFSPSGNLIAGGMYGELRIWCAETLEILFEIQQPQTEKPFALAFSPCGRYLASGTWWQEGMEKMAIRLWDVEIGKNIATLWGHPTDIQSLAFSPDGEILASGSFDGTIMLWDMTPYL